MKKDGFSVIMPTYNQATFIRRAILSLQYQTYPNWELIIINDGCTDDTDFYLKDLLLDKRICYLKKQENKGMGCAINQALSIAKYQYISYLPSDDFYFKDHLQTIYNTFQESNDIVLVYTGLQYENTDTLYHTGKIKDKRGKPNYCLQLVQTAHKKTDDRWLERNEEVTEDLFIMFWNKLLHRGIFAMTNQISCFWTSHPSQRHFIIGEKYGGGINKYRRYYNVKSPIRIRVSKEKFIDENILYQKFHNTTICKDNKPLKILIVGELAYNPERIYALEQEGHKLYGLWINKPTFCFSTVGPLPFGHVEDLNSDIWEKEIQRVQPDIIYGLLNFGAVSLAYKVLKTFPKIPFAWHFKEGPSICLRSGEWDKLIYLYTYSTIRIYLNKIEKKWFEQFIPAKGLSFIMDGDLPKKDYFKDCFSPKLSSKDGEIHTVIAGRMIGISDQDLQLLAKNKIHIHLYTENYHFSRQSQINHYKQISPNFFHAHPHCAASEWTKEFSQYDAGWLHCLKSYNNGDLLKASWDDLNIPARISTYAAAGIPILMQNNPNHIMATKECIKDLNIGILFKDYQDLSNKLKDKELIDKLKKQMINQRELFSFDYYVPKLIELFKKAIELKKQ